MEKQFDFDLEIVNKLAALSQQHQLTELTVEENGYTIQLVRHMEVATESETLSMVAMESFAFEETNVVCGVPLTAPAVGVYYSTPSPQSPPFVQEGDIIEKGQTIGLIEAMKTFNEIPAPFGGKVVQIFAQNGQLVNIGDTLMLIDETEAND